MGVLHPKHFADTVEIPMTQVWERLFLGSWDDAEKLAKSNSQRITTVVTLCDEAVVKRTRGVNYLHFPIADSGAIPVAKLDAILDAIGENIRWGKVLVNCGAGMSRAPIMTAAWMAVCGYKNVDAALEEIAGLRQIIDPSPDLLKSVKEHLR
jgi:protein-tyrosine phosphatase